MDCTVLVSILGFSYFGQLPHILEELARAEIVKAKKWFPDLGLRISELGFGWCRARDQGAQCWETPMNPKSTTLDSNHAEVEDLGVSYGLMFRAYLDPKVCRRMASWAVFKDSGPFPRDPCM